MYHALLTNRYLTTRVIPFVAVAAVALCVALVIIVVSVMTGFLDMVRTSGRTLIGDVVVSAGVRGLPYYEQLIADIEALPDAVAATPVVDGFGILRMPYPLGPHKESKPVEVLAVEAASFARVTGYADTIYWRPDAEMTPGDYRRGFPPDYLATILRDALALQESVSGQPGMVLGKHVSRANERQHDGTIRPVLDLWFMPGFELTLTMIPLDSRGAVLEPEYMRAPVLNEFAAGVFIIDKNRIIIPLAEGQRMLHLAETDRIDPDQLDDLGMPKVVGKNPARAGMVLIRAADGVTPEQLKTSVEAAYDRFVAEYEASDSDVLPLRLSSPGITISTWEEQQAQFIGPIEKERELMRTLFSLVYLVCAGLVLSIFWAIVYEKTRDIGILRSVGASRLGISWIFLRYGLVIGIGGALGGLGLGYGIVHNINAIHDAMGSPPAELAYGIGGLALVSLAFTIVRGMSGRLLPIVLGILVTSVLVFACALILLLKKVGGVVLWDPSVYYFTVIPNAVDYNTAIITMIGAVVFSLIGAFLPAAKAADVDPVQALRYE